MNHQAIRNVHPNAIIIKDLDGVAEVYDENEALISIDWDLVKAENTKLINEESALAYSRNRKAEYDALNQLELMSDDSINGTTTHKDAIVAIKAKWPKDNSGPV